VITLKRGFASAGRLFFSRVRSCTRQAKHLRKKSIVVEHTNAPWNVFQVPVQTYRQCRHKHGQIVRIVAGLVNRRIAKQPLKSYTTA